MKITLPDHRIRVDGAASVEDVGDGARFHRLDQRFADQLPLEVSFIQAIPAGVRLAFRTDATAIGVHCTPLRIALRGEPAIPAVFEAVVDGATVGRAEAGFGHLIRMDESLPGGMEFVPGGGGSTTIGDLPTGDKDVELWLPHAAGITLHGLEFADGTSLEASMSDARPRWLHHGSSISHCMEADAPTGTWPAVAAAATGHHLVGLGFAGQCHLDQFTARTIRDTTVDRISLKVGINVVNADSLKVRTFGPALHGFLDTIREGQPETPILVISPILCPGAEDVPGPTYTPPGGLTRGTGTEATKEAGALTLSMVRDIVQSVVESRVAAGDANLGYLDGRELFGQADVDAGDLPDGLHPNAAGYRRMGERFAAHPFLRS